METKLADCRTQTKTIIPRYAELTDQYKLGKTIGCGGFAKVKLATHLITGEQVAIKIMDKIALKGDLPRVNQEIEALKVLSHRNICKLYQVLESDSHIFLVMEYCIGGELFDHIVEKEKLSEEESKVFFRQIVDAVSYCHHQGFTHRDLKPENILLDHEQNLKLVDFGLCVRPATGAMLYTSCGSPNYAAPELIRGDQYFGPQVDIWSLGVLLYALLCGNLPFEDDSMDKLYRKILRGNYEEPEWLSSESRTLISRLLQVDPKRRMTTEQLCAHPWIAEGNSLSVNEPATDKENLPRDKECLEKIAQFQRKSVNRLWEELQQFRYDQTMATYYILLHRKRRKQQLRLIRPKVARLVSVDSVSSKGSGKTLNSESPFTATPVAVRRTGTLNGKRQRIRSPGLDDRELIPAKRQAVHVATPKKGEEDQSPTVGESPWMRTPGSARRMLRGLRLILTPRRSIGRENTPQPAILQQSEFSNVTGTRRTSPEAVIKDLQKALCDRGVECTQKGYTLRGKIKKPGVTDDKACKLSFELEVCWIRRPNASRRSKGKDLDGAVVGIKRKRLKGDAWIYKAICEEVLAVAAAI